MGAVIPHGHAPLGERHADQARAIRAHVERRADRADLGRTGRNQERADRVVRHLEEGLPVAQLDAALALGKAYAQATVGVQTHP